MSIHSFCLKYKVIRQHVQEKEKKCTKYQNIGKKWYYVSRKYKVLKNLCIFRVWNRKKISIILKYNDKETDIKRDQTGKVKKSC